MKQIKLNYFFIALAFTAILASCHKDKQIQKSDTPTAQRAGIYILNQGGFGNNNSTLTYYDYTTKQLTPDIFSKANADSVLGDVGNDVGIYGSKMYIVVNNSNKLDVVNAKTSKLIKEISIHQCRSVVFYKNNAFVTSYDGNVAVIDTTSLSITKHITVGRDPEQMAIVGSKLYIANSGGLDFGNPDTTVSVVDLTTLKETKKIPVIADPVSISADAYGHVYVLSLGDFNTIAGGLTVINDNTDVVLSKPAASVGFNVPMAAQGDYVYYATADNKIAMFNAKTQTLLRANFITDGTTITTPFGVAVDGTTGEVFITDATDYTSNGILYAFDKTGKKEYQLTVGICPGKIAFLNK
jgi:DNA-binding beta-propeller fold protein YncE